jgi:hypothetical protein
VRSGYGEEVLEALRDQHQVRLSIPRFFSTLCLSILRFKFLSILCFSILHSKYVPIMCLSILRFEHLSIVYLSILRFECLSIQCVRMPFDSVSFYSTFKTYPGLGRQRWGVSRIFR